MYSVLIADDETWVLESLTRGIPWTAQGFEVVGTARDGEEALERISALRPDVVITDIRMPVLSGLDLIREVNKRDLGPEFVVVSGYAEFAYAQKALQYGVAGYCVKPVEVDEVVSVLQRLRHRIESARGSSRRIAGTITLLAESDAPEQTAEHFASILPDISRSNPCRVLVSESALDELVPGEALLASESIGSRKRMAIVDEETFAALENEIDGAAGDLSTVIGASRPATSAIELHAALSEAIVASNHGFMQGGGGIVAYRDDYDPEPLRTALRAIERAIQDRASDRLPQLFEHLQAELMREGYPAHYASFVYNSCLYFASASDERLHEPIVEYEDLLDLFGGVGAMLEFLEHAAIIAASVEGAPEADALSPHEPISDVVAFVEANFVGSISLGRLSDAYFMSPSHLCRQFKRFTGSTLTQYVTKKRMEYARSLLRDTETPIGEIAEECGYDSYFYFARVFKRELQETPTTYRERHR